MKKRMRAAAVGVDSRKRQPSYGHVYQTRAYKTTKGNHKPITWSEEEAWTSQKTFWKRCRCSWGTVRGWLGEENFETRCCIHTRTELVIRSSWNWIFHTCWLWSGSLSPASVSSTNLVMLAYVHESFWRLEFFSPKLGRKMETKCTFTQYCNKESKTGVFTKTKRYIYLFTHQHFPVAWVLSISMAKLVLMLISEGFQTKRRKLRIWSCPCALLSTSLDSRACPVHSWTRHRVGLSERSAQFPGSFNLVRVVLLPEGKWGRYRSLSGHVGGR
jgi:hypothetical protein